MKSLASFFILVSLFTSFFAQAIPVLQGQSVYAIQPGTQTFAMIEDAVERIFKSPVKDNFCKIVPNPIDLAKAMGISTERAAVILQNCPGSEANYNVRSAKIFNRTYYVVYDPNHKSQVQSWTTAYNQTILFIDDELNLETLTKILAHEFAISTDGKMNMLLTTFFRFENKYSTTSGNTTVIAIPTQLSEEEEKLRLAFNASTYMPFAYAFATMRAFNVEAEMDKAPFLTVRDHQQCVSSFRELYQFFLANSERFKESQESMPGMLATMISQGNSPQDPEKTLNDVLDPQLKVPVKGRPSFCQYMARPLITNHSTYTLFANGPRPRVTGGWGDKRLEESPADDAKKWESSKKNNTLSSPRDDKKLVDSFKLDQSQQKLKQLQLQAVPFN